MRRALFILTTFLTACSGGEYRYAPDKDHAESIVNVPGGGDLRVSSLGVVDVRASKATPWTRALHVRVLASNDAKKLPWVLRPAELTLLLRGDKRLAPRFVNSEDAPGELKIAPGERRGFELYYPLPEGERTASDLSGFTFEWQLAGIGEPIRGAAAFQRIAAPEVRILSSDPYYPYGAPYGPYYGPTYWGPQVIVPAVPTRRYYSR